MNFSIRGKFLALIVGALSVSLLAQVYLGTSLINRDKVSYIYDYNLSKVQLAAREVENRLENFLAVTRALGSLHESGEEVGASLQDAFSRLDGEIRVHAYFVLRPGKTRAFEMVAKAGARAAELGAAIPGLGLSADGFRTAEYRLGRLTHGLLPVAVRTRDWKDSGRLLLVFLELSPKLLESAQKDFQIGLFQPPSEVIAQVSGLADPLPASRVSSYLRDVAADGFAFGVRNLTDGSREYIGAYQKILGDQLWVAGFTPREVAFAAGRALAKKSLASGLSILALALGLSFLFVKTLTSRLRQMWLATQKVAQGDFSFRVESKSLLRDEVTGLASSINRMSEQIEILMAEQAEKARMEAELETARAVQHHFFPRQAFLHPRLALAGKSVAATECAGDWWQYRQIGGDLIVAMGDVTGHGVSAALITAAALGAFQASLSGYRSGSERERAGSMTKVLKDLNDAVFAAGSGGVSMTLVLTVIDLEGGQIHLLNAGHTAPIIHRAQPAGSSAAEKFRTIKGGKVRPLGQDQVLRDPSGSEELSPSFEQLQPGDRIFWYTDGLLDQRSSDQRRLRILDVLESFSALWLEHPGDPEAIVERMISEASEFFGSAKDRPDDITLLCASVGGPLRA